MPNLADSPAATPATGARPRPVLVAQSILAAVGLIVGSAGFAEQLPARAAWWIITGLAAVNFGLGFYLQSRVTPLSAPQDARGVTLVPADTTQIVVTRDASGGDPTATVVTPQGTPPPVASIDRTTGGRLRPDA